MNLQDILFSNAGARVQALNITSYSVMPAMQIQYIGPKLYAKVGVGSAVATTAGNMIFYADDTDGATTVDPSIGINGSGAATTDGIIDLSTPHANYNTYWELYNHINGQENWRCELIGVRPEQLTNATLADLALTSCKTTNGLTLYLNPANVLSTSLFCAGFGLTATKFTACPSTGWEAKRTKSGIFTAENCHVGIKTAVITGTQATTPQKFRIFDCNDVAGTSVLVYEADFTSATAFTLNSTFPAQPFIESALGHRLVAQCQWITTAPTAFTAYGLVYARSIVGEFPPGGNFTGVS